METPADGDYEGVSETGYCEVVYVSVACMYVQVCLPVHVRPEVNVSCLSLTLSNLFFLEIYFIFNPIYMFVFLGVFAFAICKEVSRKPEASDPWSWGFRQL